MRYILCCDGQQDGISILKSLVEDFSDEVSGLVPEVQVERVDRQTHTYEVVVPKGCRAKVGGLIAKYSLRLEKLSKKAS